MVRAARCFRGDRPSLTRLRLRRIVSFLRRHRLFDTAHELERQTGAFFNAAHFRRLLGSQRWADASSYALGFVTPGHCSRVADTLIVRVLTLRVMNDLDAGRIHGVDALFQRLYASFDALPDDHHPRRILLSMRSDRARASKLYNGIMPMAVDVILSMAAKCPELKAKARLPRCTVDPAYIMSLGSGTSYVSRRSRGYKVSSAATGGVRPQSSAVVLIHLRRLDRFLKRQGLHSTAHTLERDSLAYFDAAHLQKLVKGGRWDDAWRYVRPFSPLWEPPEGEGTRQQHTDFLHCLEHNAMLDYLACRGKDGGRAARSLFWSSNNDDFRNKFPEIAQRHDLYRSMASERARASVDWEAIKLATLEKLQELLHLLPDCFRTRKTQRTPRPLEIIPLALRGSRRHQRKRMDRKPAHELALFLLKKRLPSGPETRHSNDVGVSSATPHEGKSAFYLSSSAANKGKKCLRSQDDYCTGNDQLLYTTECTEKPRTTGDVEEPAEISPEFWDQLMAGW